MTGKVVARRQSNIGRVTTNVSAFTGLSSYSIESLEVVGSDSTSTGGSVSIEIHTEEWFTVREPSGGVLDRFGFPFKGYSAGGQSWDDYYKGSQISFFERLVYASATITFGGTSAGSSGSAESGVGPILGTIGVSGFGPNIPGYGLQHSGKVSAFGGVSDLSWSCDISTPVGYPNTYSMTDEFSSINGSATSGSAVASSVVNTVAHSAGLDIQSLMKYGVDLTYRLRAWNKPFPSSVNYGYVTPFTGNSGSRTDTFLQWNATGYISSRSGETDAFDGYPSNPFSIHIANPEDPREWRVGFLGKAFNAGALGHRGTTSSGLASSSAWTAGANTVVSLGTSFAVAGGPGSATAHLNFANWENFRYLNLTVTSAVFDHSPMRITINGKTWSFTTGAAGVATDVTLDLCSPDNKTERFDAQETRWPVDPASGFPLSEGPYWGVNDARTVLLDQLLEGETYTVSSAELLQGEGVVSYASSANYWQQAFPQDDTFTIYRRPSMFTTFDGKRGPDWYDAQRNDPLPTEGVPNPDPTYYWPTVGDFMANVASLPGIAGGHPTLPSDGYHNLNLPAAWIYGGNGAVYKGGWREGISLGYIFVLLTGTPLFVAPMWDFVSAYPGAGDVFGNEDGSYGNLKLFANKNMRSHVGGLVLHEDGSAAAGATVRCTERDNPNIVAGSGTSNSKGAYATSLPFGRSGIYHRTELTGGALPNVHVDTPFSARVEHRVTFKTAAPSTHLNPTCLHLHSGKFLRATVEDGKLIVRKSNFGVPAPWHSENIISSDTGHSDPCLAETRFGQVHLVYGKGGNVYKRVSSDDGATWEAETLAVSGGSHPRICSAGGAMISAAYVAGNIQATFQGPGDPSMSSAFTFVNHAGGANLLVENDTFDLSFDERPQGHWLLSCVISGETVTSDWFSDDNCRSWTRL